ncbi:MAG TPA: hypothetical protein VHA56_00110 [Mucilaginibacter sp.]|nr:hypothetical protein [Mucilaginibacter sp.]
MELRDNRPVDERDGHSTKPIDEPRAQQVTDNDNPDSEDLERNLYGDSKANTSPVREGEPMGGHAFGENNNTPAGDDSNNPSRYGGYKNAYFGRTEPMEEHPEDSNFKAKYQDGEPDYDKAQPESGVKNETPKPAPAERGNGENDRPHEETEYEEGTADTEKEPNIPGPSELPDQQKVAEDDDDVEHIET